MPLAVLLLLLTQIIAVSAANGGTVAADRQLESGLLALASLDEGRALVQALADGGVRLIVVPDGDGDHQAVYDPEHATISVAYTAARMLPGALATLLAHEASHV